MKIQIWQIYLLVVCIQLLTFLIISHIARKYGYPIKTWTLREWSFAILMTFIFPIGWLEIFRASIWPFLIKER